jgi:signal peptidase II
MAAAWYNERMLDDVETIAPPEFEEVPEPVLPPATLGQQLFLFVITAVVIVLDQFSKYMVEISLPMYQSYAPIPELEALFRFTHTTNTGAAFGIFPAGGNFFTIVAVVVGLVILYYNYTLPAGQMSLRLALGLQLGGALGNVIDRFRLGHVTDFLDFGPWPVFNLADTSIVAGVIILTWLMLKEQREHQAEAVAYETEAMETADPSIPHE